MRYNALRKALGAGMAGSLLVGLGWLQAGQEPGEQQRQRPTRERGQQQAIEMPSRIHVTEANELLGRQVRTMDGQNAGQVESLMMDVSTGRISYALLDPAEGALQRTSGAREERERTTTGTQYEREQTERTTTGTQDEPDPRSAGSRQLGELLAVPWSAIDAQERAGRDFEIRIHRDRLRNAPTVREDRIAELTSPSMFTHVFDYYLTPSRPGEQETRTPEQETRTPEQETRTPEQETRTPEQETPAPEQQTRTPEQQARTSEQQGAAGAGQPHILIRREVVSFLMPPTFATVDAMTGTEVKASGGEMVGHVDKVILDVDRGYVAYVLVEKSGFLGSGSEWRALPLQALDASATDQGYRVNVPMTQIDRLEAIPRSDLPSAVLKSDLERLYQNYDVTPYWQEGERATE